MRTVIRNDTGTTLLELIAALVILGTVAAGALAILTNVTEGMVQTRTESAIAENVQAALTRITHEIANMDIKRSYTFGSSSITYYYRTDAAPSTIQLSGTTLQLNGNTLMNNLVSGTGFAVTAPSSTTPVGITMTVRVVGPKFTVNKSFNTSIELNTQRFQ